MKLKIIFIFLIALCLPITVGATNENSDVWFGNNQYTCTSSYQDKNVSTTGIAYFSYCMKATCASNRRYEISYYYNSNDLRNKNMIVNCLNGNKDPYTELYKNGCDDYDTCDKVDNIKYCSTIWKYDCGRKSDGSSFTTTTKKTTTKKRPIRITTTKPTTTTALISTKLKSITLSEGTIDFSSDVYEYNISIKDNINNIEVNAIPEDSSCTIEVKNNTNLVDGSVISILVNSTDGTNSEYKIKVTKEKTLSSNANLKSLSVEKYDLIFKNNIKDYTLLIDEEDKKLNINYETEDEHSTVEVENNSNLMNGSKISIKVVAEDGKTTNFYYISILIKEESNTLGIIFIIIIILAIIAGAYYLYIKFVKNKNGEKYEYE